MIGERDREAEAAVAAQYRREAAEFEARAGELRREVWALERSAADYRTLAASIERSHRGIDPLPPAWPVDVAPSG